MKITRLVKLTFRPEEVDTFIDIFEKTKDKIKAQEGCEHLELLRDSANKNVFFTLSKWKNEQYLNQYRGTALFEETWRNTKALFSTKADAWTVEVISETD
ncbi:MAG: antibiotic biosynthesis monooxygenase [Saprospiraceae bacterium]|nr:antibiotic biosynthesis monooxygenase [Saprospiraceae bacterium]